MCALLLFGVFFLREARMPSARADELLVDCRSVDEILLNSDDNDTH